MGTAHPASATGTPISAAHPITNRIAAPSHATSLPTSHPVSRNPTPHTPICPYTPPPPALRAVFAAQAAGVPLIRRDVPPALIAALHKHAQSLHTALQPVTELHVAAWLKKLGHLVTNPPGAGHAASQCRAIFEVCADIPAGAWGPEARLAWTRQPPRDGYPVGARWPSPNELRTILLPFANTLRRDAASSRTLLASLPASLRNQSPTPHAAA
ncbi:hypothetical protein [Acetobacter malorum]|uniref:hypothetical protein n=1 Tax=Acetobacter malorum TaxID=178901 RepID=UPI0039EC79F7